MKNLRDIGLDIMYFYGLQQSRKMQLSITPNTPPGHSGSLAGFLFDAFV
jgi:hypothetical protein